MSLLKNLERIALYAVLIIVLYIINQELHMWGVYSIVLLALMIDFDAYDRGMTDGVNVIMGTMTQQEQLALAERLTVIEEELND